jgi:hypothetical protein
MNKNVFFQLYNQIVNNILKQHNIIKYKINNIIKKLNVKNIEKYKKYYIKILEKYEKRLLNFSIEKKKFLHKIQYLKITNLTYMKEINNLVKENTKLVNEIYNLKNIKKQITITDNVNIVFDIIFNP